MLNPPRRTSSSDPRRFDSGGSAQLIDEIDALTQALYKAQAQQRSADPSSFNNNNQPARRFSSYVDSSRSAVSSHGLPSLGSSFSLAGSRHSVSAAHSVDSWVEQQASDIRARGDPRHAPSQSSHLIGSPDAFFSEDLHEWPDDAPPTEHDDGKLDLSSADKKKGFWNWKPLRALSHIGRQRFHCVFSADVHAIRNLPPAMNGLRLCVHIRKEETKEGALQTVPSRVFQGTAEFEETIMIKCTVYGSKGNSNSIKFMSKGFFVSVLAPDVEELDLGKHHLDLSRLLPHNLNGYNKTHAERGSSWSASLDLSGKARGGKLIITFSCEVLDKDSINPNELASKIQAASQRRSSMQTSYSLPNSTHASPQVRAIDAFSSQSPMFSRPDNGGNRAIIMQDLNLDEPPVTEAGKVAREQPHTKLQELPLPDSQIEMPKISYADDVNVASERDEEPLKMTDEIDSDDEQDFTVVDQGVEIEETAQVFETEELGREDTQADESKETPSRFQDSKAPEEENDKTMEVENGKALEAEDAIDSSGEKKETVTYQMVMQTLDSLLQGTSAKEQAHLQMMEGEMLGERGEHASKKGPKEPPADNLDEEVDLVTGEFLDMLESEGNYLVGNSETDASSPGAQFPKQFQQENPTKRGSLSTDPGTIYKEIPSAKSKESGPTAKVMPSASTKAPENVQRKAGSIMEKADPEDFLKKDKLLTRTVTKLPELEPLGKGLGPVINLKDGGTMRSMNPLHFQSERCNGKLVMQVSKQVVLPAEMGSGTVDILRNMASIGIENMALQTMKAMPLEEVMGLSIEQIAMEGLDAGKLSRIRGSRGSSFKLKSIKNEPTKTNEAFGALTNDGTDTCISLDSIADTAMHQIEFLAMNGLKIQVGMTDEEAPYSLHAFSMEAAQGGREDVPRHTNSATWKGVTGVHLLKGAQVPARTAGGGKGLMDMAITLDEWVLLDAGLDNEASNRNSLVARKAERATEDASSGKRNMQGGGMGNTLTMAMLIQLRDPLRSLERIGGPMIAFVQAERVVSAAENQSERQFRITGIHMAGLRAPEDNRRTGWGSQRQFRAATRWILANGMSKTRGSTVSGKAKARSGDYLWSISAQLHGNINKWKDLLKLNPHVRNPDVLNY